MSKCIEILKSNNYKIAAMTLNEEAILLDKLPVNEKLALCFGAEETALSDTINKMADYSVKIPMNGFTQSFNLSVSAEISLYCLTNKLHQSSIEWQLEEDDRANLWLVK